MTRNTSSWAAKKARLDKVKKPVRSFHLCEDPDIRDRYLKAKKQAEEVDAYLKQVKGQIKDQAFDADALAVVEKQATEAQTELADVKKAYDAATITLRFAALEQGQLEALQNAHPASEEDEAAGNDFAFDTFAPALISAASLDGMPEDDARHFLKTWAPQDARDLWNAAWSIQHQKRTDLGKG